MRNIRTRHLLFSLLISSAAWVCPAQAITDEAQKVYRVGALVAEDQFMPAFEGFKTKMAELGYIEGKNIHYDFYNAKGDRDSVQKLAEKLVHAKPDLVVTSSTTATVPIAKLTAGSNLPVVFLSAGNPLELVKSYASSGNNLTGISAASVDLTAKRLELLRELAPWVRRVVSLNYPPGVNYRDNLAAVREAEKKMGFAVRELNASSPDELRRVIRTITRKEADAILLQPDAFFAKNIEVVIQQSLKEKLPVIPTLINNVKRGGLATYSPDYFTLGQQGAALVNRILRGAKPADLPIEQPLKLVLAINLKTAKAIGLKISKEILLRADKVIE